MLKNLKQQTKEQGDFNLFVVASGILNGDQIKALFLHMVVKEVNEIYHYLNFGHAAEYFDAVIYGLGGYCEPKKNLR